MARRIVTAREQVELFAPWVRTAAALPDSHPDLHECHRVHGTVHASNGRVLGGQRTAAADFTGPQDTTFKGFNDPAGWTYHKSFQPAQIAQQGARAYSSLAGLPDPHNGSIDYLNAKRTPKEMAAVAKHYDSLPTYQPEAVKHFDAMHRDINAQHDFMTNRLGIKTQVTDYDPYKDVHEMLHDVTNNKRLQVLGTATTGGHPYLDDATNDKLRAAHDFFGHAATGRSFDRHGEQAAWMAHAQMFSPQARPALASETKGQNSSLVYNGTFGPQKTAIMDPMHWAHDLGSAQQPRVAVYDPSKTTDFILDPLASGQHGKHEDLRSRDMGPVDRSYQGAPGYNPHDADELYFLRDEQGTPLGDTWPYAPPVDAHLKTNQVAGRDSDLHEYRNERHRQEVELEGLTGGHPADIADYFARGGTPLITYKDWLNGRKGQGQAPEEPVSHEEYTPDASAWGTDKPTPAWMTARLGMSDVYDEYAGHHQAPGPNSYGWQVWDMAGEHPEHSSTPDGEAGYVPADWYTHPHYYNSGETSKADTRAVQQMYNRIRGNPEASVDVYRALPHGNTTFNTGDWVTPSLEYAKQHAAQSDDPSQDWPVIKTTVPAKHLWQNADSYYEFGYHGPQTQNAKLAGIEPNDPLWVSENVVPQWYE